MLKKYTLLMLLFSNFFLSMENDNAKKPTESGMSKTKKVLIGSAVGIVVVGGAIVLWPLVIPAATTAQITSAALATKTAAAAAAAHSSAGIALKVLEAGAPGIVAALTFQPQKPAYRAENNEYKLRDTTPNVSSHVGLGDVIVAANFSRDVIDAAGEGIKTVINSTETQPVKSEQEKTLEELEKEKAQRKSLDESIAQKNR